VQLKFYNDDENWIGVADTPRRWPYDDKRIINSMYWQRSFFGGTRYKGRSRESRKIAWQRRSHVLAVRSFKDPLLPLPHLLSTLSFLRFASLILHLHPPRLSKSFFTFSLLRPIFYVVFGKAVSFPLPNLLWWV